MLGQQVLVLNVVLIGFRLLAIIEKKMSAE